MTLCEQNALSSAAHFCPADIVSVLAKGAVSSLAWGIAPGIDGSQDSSAESAIHFRMTETHFQRLFPRRFGFLGRCLRLPVNAAPLALDAYAVITTATGRRRDTSVNARPSPRFRLPCLRGETSCLESCRTRDQSLSDVSPEGSLRTRARRCLYCFSRR